jgi:hypothetical protein
MRTDLIMMACLAVFAVAMVATADYSASTPDAVDAGQPAGAESNPETARLGDSLPDQTLAQSPQLSNEGPQLSGETAGQLRTPSEPKCAADCASRLGYQWARMHEIVDADDCNGAESAAFVEGCRAYAEEQTQQGIDRDATQKSGEP